MKLRKFLVLILAAIGITAALICFSSCIRDDSQCRHEYGIWHEEVDTCTEHIQKRECLLCGEEETQTVPPKGHTYGGWYDVVNNCTEHTIMRVCKLCSHEDVKYLVASGHSFYRWEDVVYTCTEHIQRRTCRNCNEEVLVNLEPTKPHSYGNWEYLTESCTESEQRRYCAECGGYQSRSLPQQKGHNYEVLEETDNCIVLAQKQVCTKCGDERTVALQSHGHKFTGGRCEYCDTLFYDGDTGVLDKYNGTYGYEYLLSTNTAQAELYERIDGQVRAFHLGTDINAEEWGGDYLVAQIDYSDLGLEMNDAVAVWKTYRDDNPLYYWLTGELTYTVDCLYIITEADYAQGSVRTATNDFIYNKVTEFSNKTQLGDNAYRLALAFHDAIIEAIDYTYDGRGKPESANWAHSIMGAFTGRGGVCESYAKTFQLLLNYNGVENIFVTGQGNNEAHAWNMVKLDDGNWYWCDLTWDDTPSWEWGISYYYFLVNDTENVAWRDSGWINPERNFLYNHTPSTHQGATADFLYTLPARAIEPYSEDGLTLRKTFTDGSATYAVAGYNAVQLTASEEIGAVTIPETVTYDGITYTVISIGDIDDRGLFRGGRVIAEGVTSLNIPKTVRFIWDDALRCGTTEAITVDGANEWFCSADGVLFTKSMQSLVKYPAARQAEEYRIPDECVNIVNCAFYGRSGSNKLHLSRLYLGTNLTWFGILGWGRSYDDSRNVMSGAESGLVGVLGGQGRIISPEDNVHFFTDDKALYGGSGGYLLAVFYPDTVEEFEVPAFVTRIADNVFARCSRLNTITVEEGNEAFAAMSGILYTSDYTRMVAVPRCLSGSIRLPDGLESIDDYTFNGLNIRSITLGTSVKSIGRTAFAFCENFTSIYYGGTVEEWRAIEKAELWNYGNDFKIYCSDGTLDKDGNRV